jgi:hypothetical protein
MNKLYNAFHRDQQVYVFAILTSILLSLLLGYRNSVINPDGICYVMGAKLLDSGSIKDVMQFCPQSKWPFYSTLIYALGQLSHLSYGVSAHLLNAGLSLISVLMFVKIIEKLGANQRVLWLAALVILFDHQFNLLRDNIIRDHGFWAFYLVSIYLLLKYVNEPKISLALGWNVSLVIATLFRIEGAIFLLAMPFMCWFCCKQTLSTRLKMFLMLNIPLLLMGIALAAWQFTHPDLSTEQWGRVGEVVYQLHDGLNVLVSRFQSIRAAMLQYILPHESRPDATAIVLLVWLGWYLYNVTLTLSLCYAALIIYSWFSRSISFPANTSPVILGYLAINVIMTLGFLAETLFISKRYLVGLTLVLMMWVPFAVNDLIEKWPSMRHRVFLILMTIIFFVSALSGVVDFGRSKFYIRTAGNWMSSNIPVEAKLYANDFQLMYYSDHFGMHIFEILPQYLQTANVTEGKWKQYDYLALRLRKDGNEKISPLLKELVDITPMKIFSDKRGNRVAVYKLHQDKKITGDKK